MISFYPAAGAALSLKYETVKRASENKISGSAERDDEWNAAQCKQYSASHAISQFFQDGRRDDWPEALRVARDD